MGEIRMEARGTKKPDKKASPQINSRILIV